MPEKIENLESRIERLVSLIGTDEGFYVLALHSFIEYYLRFVRGYGEELRFPELTWRFREELLSSAGDQFIDGLGTLGRLGKQHVLTNYVRHSFEAIDTEEAIAATHLYLNFLKLAKIPETSHTGKLRSYTDLWRRRISPIQQHSIIAVMQRELEELRRNNTRLLEEREEYEQIRRRLTLLQAELVQTENALQQERERAQQRADRVDELRQEKNRLNTERSLLVERLENYEDLQKYILNLARLSIYTRTRMDYERSISTLSDEQEEVIQWIGERSQYLIRGGAGTGKTLVLLELLRRFQLQRELDFGEDHSIVLVTFTRTLVRYSRYLASLMKRSLPGDRITTFDTLVYERLKVVDPEMVYDFSLTGSWFSEDRVPDFFSAEEMISEVEDYLFANNIGKDAYLSGTAGREGMRRHLGRKQRARVWELRDEFAEFMDDKKTYTKNYGRLKLLHYLQEHGDDVFPWKVQTLLVDEVQDMTPVALRILRLVCRKTMVMTGDDSQCLYTPGLALREAGIVVRGTTRVLKTNFRSTRQITEAAERFAGEAVENGAAGENRDPTLEPVQTRTFREGPVPELHLSTSAKELGPRLFSVVSLLVEEIGYECETIGVLVPRKREIASLIELFEEKGYPVCSVMDNDFAFESESGIRISTLHSGKGLDFPVVLLYLPYLYRREQYSRRLTDRLLRNLLYVGLTRAMDIVDVFTVPGVDPVLDELIHSFSDE